MPNPPPVPPSHCPPTVATATGGAAPLRSEFAGDPDMADLVRAFVQEMPRRLDALVACWEGQQMEDLRRLAHQLKGAGGGYGFPDLGEGARRLEDSIEALSRSTGKSSNHALRCAFEDLVGLCKRVTTN